MCVGLHTCMTVHAAWLHNVQFARVCSAVHCVRACVRACGHASCSYGTHLCLDISSLCSYGTRVCLDILSYPYVVMAAED